MNCPDCGIPVEQDAKFCPKCYARIEPPGLLRRIVDFFKPSAKPDVRVQNTGKLPEHSLSDMPLGAVSQFRSEVRIIKSEKPADLITVEKDGQRHEYHSLDEVPPEMRAQFEKLESEVKQETDKLLSGEIEGLSTGPHEIISKKIVSIYKVKDASGQEHIYHSLDELPPKIRDALKRIQGPPGANS
jgi:hypothetical protein